MASDGPRRLVQKPRGWVGRTSGALLFLLPGPLSLSLSHVLSLERLRSHAPVQQTGQESTKNVSKTREVRRPAAAADRAATAVEECDLHSMPCFRTHP